MPQITKQQSIAIFKGMRMYQTAGAVTTNVSTRWPGVQYSDLFNPSGINLTNSSAATPVYPYIPGTGDPASQVFTQLTSSTTTIFDSTISLNVLILYNGGDLNGNGGLSAFEKDYHKTGLKIQKKIK